MDYFGLVSGRKADKWAVTGLTPVRSDQVDAPYVGEFPVVLECKVAQVHELGLHTQFIGEILDGKIDEACFDEEGNVDARLISPIYLALEDNHYYGKAERLARAWSVGRELAGDEGEEPVREDV